MFVFKTLIGLQRSVLLQPSQCSGFYILADGLRREEGKNKTLRFLIDSKADGEKKKELVIWSFDCDVIALIKPPDSSLPLLLVNKWLSFSFIA